MERKLKYGLVFLVVLSDQLSKIFARRFLPVKENPGLPFFGIDLPGYLDLVLIVFLLLVFTIYYFKYYYPRIPAGFSLIFAGAASNILDRIVRGTVTDFIDLGIGNTFNLADIAIFAGMVYLFIQLNVKRKAQNAKQQFKI